MAGNWVIQINTRAGDPNFPEVLQGFECFSRIEDYKKLLAELRRELVTLTGCKLLYNISICYTYIGVLLPCRPI